MKITREQLLAIMPDAGARADIYLDPLNATMEEFEIDTPERMAAFLAQVAHESGQLRYVKELASGAAYDTGRLAERLGNTPEADGDGQFHKGAGLIQLTGKRNQFLCADYFELPRENIVEWLQTPEGACRSAGWFWTKGAALNLSPAARQRCGTGCDLNDIADRRDFLAITYAVNGGTNGLEDRVKYYARAQQVLNDGAVA